MEYPQIHPILGRLPSGIFILTTIHGDQTTGMLASWVMQAGFSPPMITVAVQHDRHVKEWLSGGQPFVLNVVGESQKSLIRHFGQGFAPDDETVFEGLEITHCPRGVPILTYSIGHLECEPVDHVDSVDHRIFLAVVNHGRLANDEPPLVHIRKSGGHY